MGIVISLFSLFLVSALPGIIESSQEQWERFDEGGGVTSEEEQKKKFTEHPGYKAMYERYPNASEEWTYRHNSGSMDVGAMNVETGNQLILSMYYHEYNDEISSNLRCVKHGHDDTYVEGLFVKDFIKNTDCLE